MDRNYFSETTLRHLKKQQDITLRHFQRVLDVTLACKLTLVYGKYNLMMLHRHLAMSEEQTSFQIITWGHSYVITKVHPLHTGVNN